MDYLNKTETIKSPILFKYWKYKILIIKFNYLFSKVTVKPYDMVSYYSRFIGNWKIISMKTKYTITSLLISQKKKSPLDEFKEKIDNQVS